MSNYSQQAGPSEGIRRRLFSRLLEETLQNCKHRLRGIHDLINVIGYAYIAWKRRKVEIAPWLQPGSPIHCALQAPMMIKEKFRAMFSGDSYARGGIQEPNIKNWRERIFQQMLKSMTVFGLLVVIPSAWLAFRAGLLGLALFSILAYLLTATLFFARGLRYQPRAVLFLVLIFAVGLFVLTNSGVGGAGFIWLFIVPAMASLLLGLSWGLFFLGLNVLISLGLGYLIYLSSPTFSGLAHFDLSSWSINAINFFIANLVVSASLGALLDGQLKSEQEVVDVQAFNERILDTSPVGVVVYEAEGGDCILANPSAAELIGGTEEAMLQQNFYEIESWQNSGLLDTIKKAIETSRSQSIEVRVLSTFGKEVFLQCEFTNLNMGGRPLVMLTMSDVSKIKLAEERLEKQFNELNIVNQISTVLQEASDLNEMLPSLLGVVLDVFSLEAGGIWLYDAAQDEVRLEFSLGYHDDDGQQPDIQPEKPGTGLAGAIFERGDVFVSNEFRQEERIPAFIREQIPEGVGGLVVPINSESKTIGVISINTRLPQKAEDLNADLLVTLANIAGNAIQRASLHKQTQRGLRRLIALGEIDRVILSSNDLAHTLDAVISNIRTNLDVDACSVLLLNKDLNLLEFAGGQGFRNKDFAVGQSVSVGQGYAGQVALERRLLHIENINERSDNPTLLRSIKNEGFAEYLALPLLAKGDLVGVLEIYHRAKLDLGAEWFDFLRAIAGQASIAIENASLFAELQSNNIELREAYDSTIEGWSHALDLRDHETMGHSQRVADLTVRLARRIGVDDDELAHIRRGALLHDIGKMGIPDSILLKPDKLTDSEWKEMRKHPVYARDMLRSVRYLKEALEIPYHHHERWDGSGYPRGLKGDDIPLSARIFAVVDVFDALTSDRPYRDAWSVGETVDYIRSEAGQLFDPKVVLVFLELLAPQNGSGRDAIIAAWQKQN